LREEILVASASRFSHADLARTWRDFDMAATGTRLNGATCCQLTDSSASYLLPAGSYLQSGKYAPSDLLVAGSW
jgi:hypothetical protein